MKVLHTSDWHLGQEFHTYDRTREHISFLHQLRNIVSEEKPDLMVISGDIYHTAAPSNSVMRLFVEHLDAIRQACPSMMIVVTAGNHDGSSRLEVNRSLWSHLGVTVLGRIERKEDGPDFDRHILPVTSPDGVLTGYVVALPHVFPHSFPQVEEDTPREERQRVFMRHLGNRLREVNPDGLPVVMMAHLAVAGSDYTGHDQSRGGMDFIDASELEVPYDYLALGHIHCPQTLNTGRERYSGSPVPVSFDEDYQHSVTVAELEKGQEPVIRTVDIDNPIPLYTIPEEPAAFEEVLALMEDFPADRPGYIRLNVSLEDVPPANAMQRAAEALKGKQARFCTIRWHRPVQSVVRSDEMVMDVEEIRAMSPMELAAMHYEEKYGAAMPEEIIRLLEEAVNEVNQ